MKPIHTLGRVIIIDNHQILLCREKGKKHTFLPGGHAEYNEGIKKAIVREIKEEIGETVIINDFIGIVEHSFLHKEFPYYEINHIFSGEIVNITSSKNPNSLEEHIEFLWCPMNELDIGPEPIKEIIQNYYFSNIKGVWKSTLE